jgi:ABC-type transport system involved in multi-copper enzyme maturation permease subunit
MWLTPLLAIAFCVGLAAMVSHNYVSNWGQFSAEKKATFEPLDVNFNFLIIGVLFFGVLGALVVTSEYGNGLMRTTLAALPQRGLVLAAKTVLLALIALVTSTAIALLAVLIGQGEMSGHIRSVSLLDAGPFHRFLGAVLYMTAAGLLGLFMGVLTRSTAAAMSGVFGLFLVLPTLVNNLPKGALWRHTVPYLPSNLGNALWHSHGTNLARTTVAAPMLVAYVVVLGVAAALSLRKRDA